MAIFTNLNEDGFDCNWNETPVSIFLKNFKSETSGMDSAEERNAAGFAQTSNRPNRIYSTPFGVLTMTESEGSDNFFYNATIETA
jgi:hypothetical protein